MKYKDRLCINVYGHSHLEKKKEGYLRLLDQITAMARCCMAQTTVVPWRNDHRGYSLLTSKRILAAQPYGRLWKAVLRSRVSSFKRQREHIEEKK